MGEPSIQPASTTTTGPRCWSTSLTPEEILERLTTASRRGRLPGFHPRPPRSEALFSVDCHSHPFEGRILATAKPNNPGITLCFRTRFKPLIPAVFVGIMLLSIWPGVILTESLIASLIPGSFWKYTWWWYLPLSVVSAPWAIWEALRRSNASALAETTLVMAKLSNELGGRAD